MGTDPPSDSIEVTARRSDGTEVVYEIRRERMEPPSDFSRDLLYDAWCVIANAVGWDDDTEWRRAAIRWRDAWHEMQDMADGN